jgi:hypothetical protein
MNLFGSVITMADERIVRPSDLSSYVSQSAAIVMRRGQPEKSV